MHSYTLPPSQAPIRPASPIPPASLDASDLPLLDSLTIQPPEPTEVEKLQSRIDTLEFSLKKLEDESQEKIESLQEYCHTLEEENAKLKVQVGDLRKAVNSFDKIFSPEQIQMITGKIKNPREWSEKAVTTAMYIRWFVGTTGYKFLRSLGFPFPCETSIINRLSLMTFSSGTFLEDNARLLKMQLDMILPEGAPRDAQLCWDGMQIKRGINVNPSTQQIMGFCDIPPNPPGSKSKKDSKQIVIQFQQPFHFEDDDEQQYDEDDEFKFVAKWVNVFILCGLRERWKVILGFFYTGVSFEAEPMKNVVFELIRGARDFCQVQTRCLTNDMGPCERGVWNALGIDTSRDLNNQLNVKNSFVVDGVPCRVSADQEHVAKNTRNNLRNLWCAKNKRLCALISEAHLLKYKHYYPGMIKKLGAF